MPEGLFHEISYFFAFAVLHDAINITLNDVHFDESAL